jgi:hypothetical protein
MNIVRRETVAATGAAFCDHCWTLGLCWSGDAVMGDAFWCKHLVAMRGAFDRSEGAARERLRMAARGACIEAILYVFVGIGSQR